METARAFLRAGTRWVHIVDLDGARDGTRKNGEIVQAVSDVGLHVELGGGIRSMSDLEEVFDLGVSRAVIGSAAVTHPQLVSDAVKRWGDKIAVGVDTKDGRVKTAGWVEDSGMEKLGVRTIIFTDIETDGTLSGPNFGRLEELQRTVGCHIVASGGVSNNGDIRVLAAMGLYGAIIGKAYYAGTIDLARAVADGGTQE